MSDIHISIFFWLIVPTVQSICEANLYWLANVSIRCLPHRKDAIAAVAASRSIFVIRLMTNLNGESQTLSLWLSLSLSVAAWVANLVIDICNILHVAFEQSRPRATHVALDEVAAVASCCCCCTLLSLPASADSHSHSHWHWQWHSLPLCRSAAAARFCRSHGARLSSSSPSSVAALPAAFSKRATQFVGACAQVQFVFVFCLDRLLRLG